MAQAWGQKAGLSAVKVDDALASVHRPYWSIGDSFMGWGEAIARQLDATFKIYGDTAVFVSRSGGQSVSGRDLEDVNVTWGDNLIEWSIAPILSRPDFGTFGTRWYDPKAAHWKEETEDGSGSSKSQVKHQHKFKAATQDQAQQQSGSNQSA